MYMNCGYWILVKLTFAVMKAIFATAFRAISLRLLKLLHNCESQFHKYSSFIIVKQHRSAYHSSTMFVAQALRGHTCWTMDLLGHDACWWYGSRMTWTLPIWSSHSHCESMSHSSTNGSRRVWSILLIPHIPSLLPDWRVLFVFLPKNKQRSKHFQKLNRLLLMFV